MSTKEPIEQRLLKLGQVIAGSRTGPPASSGDVDVADVMLASVTTDRIRGTTAELERGSNIDATTAVAMRLLLSDYSAAVASLRTVTRATEHRLDGVDESIRNGLRLVERLRDHL